MANPAAAPVQIQFDSEQPHQIEAIQAVTDLLVGQPLATSTFEMASNSGIQGSLLNEYGMANNLVLTPEQLVENIHAVQVRNGLKPTVTPGDPESLGTLDFTSEMETGTGKTYVYLRSAFELNRIYGLTKFVIVVPSVAIREGVEANLRLLASHFRALYDGVQYNTLVYSSKDVSRLRAFAQANYMQFLIINIDSFNKEESNVIHQSQDRMLGRAPIEFVRACAPVVILDEPQNMKTPVAKAAIASLGPSLTLRYSATPGNLYHPVYRLTPVDAYNHGLVKRIDVWSVTEDTDLNTPHIEVTSIKASSRSVKAQVAVQAQTPKGTKTKKVACVNATDLELETGRSVYAGYVVEDIDVPSQTITFGNGVAVRVGEPIGPDKDAIQRAQIRTAITEHLDRELDIARRVAAGEIAPTKILTLFFIDKVVNYWPVDGKFRLWFEAEYSRLAALPKYKSLPLPAVGDAHNGYFAKDKKTGEAKDTRGTSETDDAAAYDLIMRSKDRLLSTAEPLRFIFSHSALREGWDNPNVFVICTLNETISDTKKRQEIGRGLRLPVSTDGTQCKNPEVARLAIVANESYDDFATALQKEIEEDTGTAFPKSNIKRGRDRRTVEVRKGYDSDVDFVALWERIKHRTTYRVQYATDELIALAAARLATKPEMARTMIRAVKGSVTMDDTGVSATLAAERTPRAVTSSYPVPDLLGHLTRALPTVSRATIANILVKSGRLADATKNPQHFIDVAHTTIEDVLAELLVDGISYDKMGSGDDAIYEMRLFEDNEITAYLDNVVTVSKGVYHEVSYDSDLEKDIALALDAREDIRVFVKLPGWFTIATPAGRYNPDWAYVKTDEDGVNRLYLVRESKPSRDLKTLRPSERLKVLFGERHFDALNKDAAVDFAVIDSPAQV